MPNAKEARIKMYMHCNHCLKKNAQAKIAVGWTEEGFQVVCETCGKSVADFDLQGNKVVPYNWKARAIKRPKQVDEEAVKALDDVVNAVQFYVKEAAGEGSLAAEQMAKATEILLRQLPIELVDKWSEHEG